MKAIAIDGPAASGKSTAAKGVAKRLDFLYVDTGAMYRAVTLKMLQMGLDTKSLEDAKKAIENLDIREDRQGHIYLDGVDVTDRVREKDVSSQVSYACAHLPVRQKLVALQQQMAMHDDVVMEGRDIGTAVLPAATVKIFQVASVDARAKRRYLENQARHIESSLEEIKADIAMRDYLDSHRENSPLCKADDAIELDTSDMTIDEEIDAIVALYEKKMAESR